jgi:hypothetical protein
MKEEEVRGATLRFLASRGRKDRIGKIHMAFVPYYRLSGLDFCWTWREKTVSSPLLERCPETNASLLFGPSQSEGLDPWDASPLPPLKEKEYSLAASHLDRSFLAADLPALTLRSLSVRPQVLTLRLFDPKEIGRIGRIIPVAMAPKEAWDKVGKDFTPDKVTRRGIINRTLSLIFFPIWEVELEPDERVGSLLFDAVGRTLLQETPSPFFPGPWKEADFSAQTLRFRPLSCPNCASGLPVEPDYRIFSCPACHRVWHIQGDEFADLPYRVAMAPVKTDEKKDHYLPIWVFLGQVFFEERQIRSKYDLNQIAPMARLPQEADRNIPLRFFIPAFKLRDLAVANRLATSFTRMQPPVHTREPSGEPLHPGAVLDREEAAAFAQITLVSIAPKASPRRVEAVAGADISLSPGELVFFPFREQGNSLQEDFLGTAIQLNTLR